MKKVALSTLIIFLSWTNSSSAFPVANRKQLLCSINRIGEGYKQVGTLNVPNSDYAHENSGISYEEGEKVQGQLTFPGTSEIPERQVRIVYNFDSEFIQVSIYGSEFYSEKFPEPSGDWLGIKHCDTENPANNNRVNVKIENKDGSFFTIRCDQECTLGAIY